MPCDAGSRTPCLVTMRKPADNTHRAWDDQQSGAGGRFQASLERAERVPPVSWRGGGSLSARAGRGTCAYRTGSRDARAQMGRRPGGLLTHADPILSATFPRYEQGARPLFTFTALKRRVSRSSRRRMPSAACMCFSTSQWLRKSAAGFATDLYVADGDMLDLWYGLKVVSLPGPTPGHCGYSAATSDLLLLRRVADAADVVGNKLSNDTNATPRSLPGKPRKSCPRSIHNGRGVVRKEEDFTAPTVLQNPKAFRIGIRTESLCLCCNYGRYSLYQPSV